MLPKVNDGDCEPDSPTCLWLSEEPEYGITTAVLKSRCCCCLLLLLLLLLQCSVSRLHASSFILVGERMCTFDNAAPRGWVRESAAAHSVNNPEAGPSHITEGACVKCFTEQQGGVLGSRGGGVQEQNRVTIMNGKRSGARTCTQVTMHREMLYCQVWLATLQSWGPDGGQREPRPSLRLLLPAGSSGLDGRGILRCERPLPSPSPSSPSSPPPCSHLHPHTLQPCASAQTVLHTAALPCVDADRADQRYVHPKDNIPPLNRPLLRTHRRPRGNCPAPASAR